jgi:peptidoglycan/xylan/chitin deacetylase (PgdA/CDA1 family)
MNQMEKKQNKHFWKDPRIARFYYSVKPLIPRWIQIHARRFFIRRALPGLSAIWPIDPAAAKPPKGWGGWPDDKRFALVLTHDVESEQGLGRCRHLADMEMELGFRSSFNFLLSKYTTPNDLRIYLEENGFEIGIHGCYHDGMKFSSREIFLERAKIINRYIKEWGASGFRAPSMQCNLDWVGDLNIEYDLSTFDTDPFEPNSSGVQTIYPFMVSRSNGKSDFVELPYTLPQDSTLFVVMGEKNINIWKSKLDWIVENRGMALINTHPDYMNFGKTGQGIDEYPSHYYSDFLSYVKTNYSGQFWHGTARELAAYYRG